MSRCCGFAVQQIEALQQIRNKSDVWSFGLDLLWICCCVADNHSALIDMWQNDATAWRVLVCELTHTMCFIASACIKCHDATHAYVLNNLAITAAITSLYIVGLLCISFSEVC